MLNRYKTDMIEDRTTGRKLSDQLSDMGVNINSYRSYVLNLGQANEDWKPAFDAAITYLNSIGGGELYVPYGDYNVSSTIILYSNITIKVKGRILFDGSTLFSGVGTVGPEINLSVNKAMGDTSISTVTSHFLAVDDLVYIVSQRDSISDDGGEDWRLGYATPAAQGCYYGEFVRVKSITNSTTFTITSGLIFPSYRIDKTLEVAPLARAASTIRKFTPIENVTIEGLRVKGAFSIGVNFQYAYNCTVERSKFFHNNDGVSVNFKNSLSCEGFRCENFFTSSTTPVQIYSRNGFKIISSQSCGFHKCYSENGSQCFDITYSTANTASLHCYIKDCETKGASTNAATSHGGTYACMFLDNLFVDNLSNGLSVRSRSSIISGNRIFGANGTNTNNGIMLYEGWARDCVVEGNSITGFGYGIQVQDGADAGEQFGWVGALIKSNTITNCFVGVDVDRSSLNKYLLDAGVLIQGNTVKNIRSAGKCVRIHDYVAGTDIKDNTLDASNIGSGCIYGYPNCGDMRITGNKFMNSTSRAIWIDGPADSTSYPNGVEIVHNNNKLVNIGNSTPHFFGTNVRGYSFPKQAAAGVTNNTLFIDTVDDGLKYKKANGTIVVLG
jgi:hypothetical protein